jgi:hypothetical protein
MTVPSGKQIFLWNVPAGDGGNPEAIADLLSLGGFDEVWVKAANGAYPHVPNRLRWPLWGQNLRPEFVQVMHARKIRVIGWGYCFGDNFLGEADIAIKTVKELGLDGWGFNCETKFESYSDCGARAYKMCNRTRQALPDTPLAFVSWAYWKSPTSGARWHAHEMAHEGMKFCDVGVPMMYWPGDSSASALYQLDHSTKQWTELVTDKPIVPAGRAYDGDGGNASPVAIADFGNAVKELGYIGCNWWSLDWVNDKADLWGALVATPGFGGQPPEPPPAPSGLAVRVLTEGLRLRSSPHADLGLANVIGGLHANVIEKAIDVAGDPVEGGTAWVKLAATESHPEGWAAMFYRRSRHIEAVENALRSPLDGAA